MPTHERTPHERETLIFPDAEKAQEFKEQINEQLEQQKGPSPQGRAVVANAVAAQFAGQGEAVELVREPWIHSPQEHAEAQHLVDVAFARDLGAAIAEARKSPHYPRNLDLLHDVLTGELYQLVQQHRLSHQPLGGWGILLVSVILLLSLLLLLIILFA